MEVYSLKRGLLIFLQSIVAVFAITLMIQEMYNYHVTKPTSVDKTTTDMKFGFAPEILFCPQPAFQLKHLNDVGYKGLKYMKGKKLTSQYLLEL